MVGGSDGRGELPWGWWLRANGGYVEDEEGGRWSSVLEAFWHGHLGFPKSGDDKEQLELLLRVLAAMERRPLAAGETQYDLFDGDLVFRRHYMAWLVTTGLTAMPLDRSRWSTPLDANLTDYGRSVLMLLQVTREKEWIDLPFTRVAADHLRSERGDRVREATLRAFEGEVSRRRYVFARELLHGGPSVSLTGMIGEGRMPLRRVIWSQRFEEDGARDDFFAWLAERVDRWDAWGDVAYRRGAAALTQHLMVLLASARPH